MLKAASNKPIAIKLVSFIESGCSFNRFSNFLRYSLIILKSLQLYTHCLLSLKILDRKKKKKNTNKQREDMSCFFKKIDLDWSNRYSIWNQYREAKPSLWEGLFTVLTRNMDLRIPFFRFNRLAYS